MTSKLSVRFRAPLTHLTTCVLQVLDVALHRALRAAIRKIVGQKLAQFVQFKVRDVAGVVQQALKESFTEESIRNGWRKTCLDTLDPTPLVAALEARKRQLSESLEQQAKRKAEYERMCRTRRSPTARR
jgi:hypothetical protein